jgi:hypothetical protein
VTHDDDRLRVPLEPQELSGHVSSGGQTTSYDISDRWSNTTTDRDFIGDYPIIRIYNDKIRLLFIKSYSTSAETSAQSDRKGEPVGQIGAHATESVCVE